MGNTDGGKYIIYSLPQVEGDSSMGVAFYFILNSQNKNPYEDTRPFIKTQTESNLDIASLIIIYVACFWTLYQLFRKKYICNFT